MSGLFGGVQRPIKRLIRTRLPGLAWHISGFHRAEDRRLLVEVIFPYLIADRTIDRVLFVGCEWYTKPYEKYFRQKEYWTLEIDREKRKYGSKRHIVDALCNLPRHIAPGYFDAIICNGVFMVTAIETREAAEPSFLACHTCLRSGGLFVLGWNDTVELRPYPPEESETLAKFEPFIFPPLSTDRHLTNTDYRHVFSFFVKPRSPSGQGDRANSRGGSAPPGFLPESAFWPGGAARRMIRLPTTAPPYTPAGPRRAR